MPLIRQRFTEIAASLAAQLQKTFIAEGIDSLRLETDQFYLSGLMAFFKNRTRKRS